MLYPATATARALAVLDAVAQVADAAHPTGGVVDQHPGDMAVCPHLGAVGQRVGDVGDQRARLGVDLATLQAEPAVDAMRPVAEPAVGDRDRPDAGLDPRRPRAAQEHVAVAADRVGVVGVGVRLAPRPVLAGDGQLGLDRPVVGAQVGVADRPIGPDPVKRGGVEVARVQPGGIAGVVHHRPADAASAVVRAQRHRVGAADLPRLGPVQGVAAALVTDPVGVRVPERAGIQADHVPPGAGEALGQHAAAGAGADDDQVDLVVAGEAAHVPAQRVVGARAVVGDQPGRVVALPDFGVAGPHCCRCPSLLAVSGALVPVPVPVRAPSSCACARRARSVRSANGTGSVLCWSATSQPSRASRPMFL